jgi:hypothetical protein
VRGRWLTLAIALGATCLQPSQYLAAQDVAGRLDGRVPANVVRAVQGIAQDAEKRGLPVEPLIQKAIEGGAKGVADDRVIAAVRVLASRLGQAQSALRDAGISAPNAEALEGGADALNAGLNPRDIRDLGRVSRPPYDPALTLRVAATLTALGVPPQQGLRLMEHMIQAGREPTELLGLPNEVQVDMTRGATAEQAAETLITGKEAESPEAHQGQEGQHGEADQHGQEDQQGQQGPSVRKP